MRPSCRHAGLTPVIQGKTSDKARIYPSANCHGKDQYQLIRPGCVWNSYLDCVVMASDVRPLEMGKGDV